MIKAVVFDMDGMLFREPRFFTEEVELKYGIPVAESQFSKDPAYLACKKDEITFDAFFTPYYEKWKKHPKFTLSFDEAKKEWFDFTQLDNKVFEVARKLKEQGIINLIVTNNVRERTAYLAEKHDLPSLFEIIGSPDLHALKPDPIFYTELKRRYALEPSDVLYFDDKEATIETLKQHGFQAVQYHTPEDLVSTLHNAGIAIA